MSARGDAVGMSSLKVTMDTSLWRNASPPSHLALQLPLELLQKIFLILADLSLPPQRFFESPIRVGPYQPDWIVITHVCRYWRSAALRLPELWSTIIPGYSFSWSRAMVERSAPLPMRINTSATPSFLDEPEWVASLKLILACPRIRSLRISGHCTDVLTVLNFVCCQSIKTLDLWVMESLTSNNIDLPVTLFGGKAPHLRHLNLGTFARVRAPGWLLSGVTHFATSTLFSLQDLLDTLQVMPQLEVLCIVAIITTFHEPDPYEHVPPRRVTLPRLSLLSFDDNTPHRLATLSSLIDAPPTLRRHLTWWVGAVSSWDKWASMLTVMQALVPGDSALGSNDGGLRVAHLVNGYEGGSFEVWSRTCSESASMAARKEALFLFHIDWSDSRPNPRGTDGLTPYPRPTFFLASLCVHLRTAHIEDLAISPAMTIDGTHNVGKRATDAPHPPDAAAQWQALLAALPSVKTLRLYRGSPACVSILRALSASADPLLPHLQRIVVVHSAVYPAAPACPDGVGVAGTSPSVASREFVQANVGAELVEAVSCRSGLEVVLAGCEVDEKALDALRKRARVYIGHERVYV